MKRIRGFFQRLFGEQPEKQPIPPMPTWEKIVEMMQHQPPRFRSEVTRVLYSTDKTARFVIWKKQKGYYTVRHEIISAVDEDEWEYVYTHNQLPGWWEESHQHWGVYATESAALADIQASFEYKSHFEKTED